MSYEPTAGEIYKEEHARISETIRRGWGYQLGLESARFRVAWFQLLETLPIIGSSFIEAKRRAYVELMTKESEPEHEATKILRKMRQHLEGGDA